MGNAAERDVYKETAHEVNAAWKSRAPMPEGDVQLTEVDSEDRPAPAVPQAEVGAHLARSAGAQAPLRGIKAEAAVAAWLWGMPRT
ncbi:hypothetical protein CYMTET_25458 [Cymbomonas tetramitiformis]|uniref:Uncharacterized protein n=1 Tax=Cymbomonas tetramitiformis TaxID=36881 RepID=A0AAE0KZ15_9CHLO|nr:hypothetical protein CYMTET_25458 [Cymbomonas tetramitiformis]